MLFFVFNLSKRAFFFSLNVYVHVYDEYECCCWLPQTMSLSLLGLCCLAGDGMDDGLEWAVCKYFQFLAVRFQNLVSSFFFLAVVSDGWFFGAVLP